MHRNRFVLISQSRSGSTLLRCALNGHPRICCHGELYSEGNAFGYAAGNLKGDGQEIQRKLTEIRAQLPHDEFMRTYVFPEIHYYRAMGVKVLDTHLNRRDIGPYLCEFIARNEEVKLIFLYRENQLHRYLSHLLLRKQIATDRRAEVPLDAFVSFLNRSLDNLHVLHARFVKNPRLSLSYEQVVARFETVLPRCHDFLGVESAPVGAVSRKAPAPEYGDFVANHTQLERLWQERRPAFEAAYAMLAARSEAGTPSSPLTEARDRR